MHASSQNYLTTIVFILGVPHQITTKEVKGDDRTIKLANRNINLINTRTTAIYRNIQWIVLVPVVDSTECITNNPDFKLLCLTPIVLRNVIITLNNVRADGWEVGPPNNWLVTSFT